MGSAGGMKRFRVEEILISLRRREILIVNDGSLTAGTFSPVDDTFLSQSPYCRAWELANERRGRSATRHKPYGQSLDEALAALATEAELGPTADEA